MSEPKRNRRNTWLWGLVCLISAYGGFAGLIALAGVNLFPPFLQWFEIEPLVDQAKGNAVAAAVAWAGGIIGLGTFFLNREQKERHEDAKGRRERDLAELQRLERHFEQLGEDFASDSTLEQINAAIGLSELALTPDPRLVDNNGIVDGNRDEKNYPYFMRAANRLAASLHQWHADEPISEVRKALSRMGEWAHDDDKQALLRELAASLADSNRIAYRRFSSWIAKGVIAQCDVTAALTSADANVFTRWLGAHGAWEETGPGVRSQAIAARKIFLDKFGAEIVREQFLANSDTNADVTPPYYLRSMDRYARSLITCRDALADVLRLFKLGSFQRLSQNLGHCFLSCSDLSLTNLSDADLSHSELQCANLEGANLDDTLLDQCQLQQAKLVGASIKRSALWLTNLDRTEMQSVSLRESKLNAASCDSASLVDADLVNARFERVSLVRADLRYSKLGGCNLKGSDMEGTKLYGAACETDGLKAKLDPTVLDEADFHAWEQIDGEWFRSDKTDEDLIEWLKVNTNLRWKLVLPPGAVEPDTSQSTKSVEDAGS